MSTTVIDGTHDTRAPAGRGVRAALDCFDPAEVIEAHGREVLVELPQGGRVQATLAFPFPYTPAAGDVLLIAGKGEVHYAIGVIQGAGTTALRFPGDVEIAAEGGALRLSGDRGVEVRGPEIAIHGDKLRMAAESVIQTFASAYQRVTELLSVHARKAHTAVDEDVVTHSKRATITTEETVVINGREVHLG